MIFIAVALVFLQFLPALYIWYHADGKNMAEDYYNTGLFAFKSYKIDLVTQDGKHLYKSIKNLVAVPVQTNIIGVIVFVLCLIYIRRLLADWDVELDETTYTQSDYCLIGRNMFFKNETTPTKEGSMKEVSEYLEKRHGIKKEEIIYISPSFAGSANFKE